MSDGNDMVAMEHMFSDGGAFGAEADGGEAQAEGGEPTTPQSYEVRHRKAVEKIEVGVRMQQACLHALTLLPYKAITRQ